MKVLYAVQGTGNGHMSRAREVLPHLEELCDLEVAVTGTQSDVDLPHKPEHALAGLSFSFGKKGGISYIDTLKNLRPIKFLKDLKNFPIEDYDLVINDFEPVTAWAAKRKGVPSVAMSHQASFLSENTPRPDKQSKFAEFIMRNFAPTTEQVGFHYKEYDTFIKTPLVRSEVRALLPEDKGHFTVYLPAYGDDRMIELLNAIPGKEFEVFSKHARCEYESENVRIKPIENAGYLESLRTCSGLLTGGGFEAPSEALYLGKRLLVIPMSNQYEQLCNAEALKEFGVPVLQSLSRESLPVIAEWVQSGLAQRIDYPDQTAEIVEEVIHRHENPNNRNAFSGVSLPKVVHDVD